VKPALHLIVDFVRLLQPEHVDLIARRDDVDAPEARALEPPRQHDVAVHPMMPQAEGGKAHSHLESDARFLGQNLDRAGFLGRRQQGVEGGDHLRIATSEVVLQPDVAAKVKLIPIREGAPAFWARPQRLHRAQLTISRS
jgi:hypothetical protein